MGGGKDHSLLVPDRLYQIEQLGICSDGPAKGCLEQVHEGTFNIIAEKIRGNLNRKLGPVQRDGHDGLEPGIELLLINVVLNDLQTVIPYRNMSFLVQHGDRFRFLVVFFLIR